MAESIPGLDLVPTWTAAAYMAIRKKKGETMPPANQVVIDV
jgi:hypothetical protein